MNKPVITFGDAFYNILPVVKRCRTVEELPTLVESQLRSSPDEKTLLNFITAIYAESTEINMIQLWNIEGGSGMEKKEKELAPLVDLIASKLGLQPIKNEA